MPAEIARTERRLPLDDNDKKQDQRDEDAQERSRLGLPVAFGSHAQDDASPSAWQERVDPETGAAFFVNVRNPHIAPTWDPPQLPPVPTRPDLLRYYAQRYSLFQRFDEGVRMDDDAWFSVTPERLARHQARRLAQQAGRSNAAHCVAVDVFAGAGGNSIQLAHHRGAKAHVLGVELDVERAHDAAHNANVYGVRWRVDIVIADARTLLPRLRAGVADAVFCSPPWGGPRYRRADDGTFDAATLEPLSLAELWRASRRLLASRGSVAVFLPRTTTDASLAAAASEAWEDDDMNLEIETAYVGYKPVGVTVYKI